MCRLLCECLKLAQFVVECSVVVAAAGVGGGGEIAFTAHSHTAKSHRADLGDAVGSSSRRCENGTAEETIVHGSSGG
jgi:hypothetical protein